MECIMDMEEIGQLICKARKSRKLSQGSLGQQLGMSRATISGIENGTVPEIGIRKILSICRALGLELLAQEKTKRPTLQQLLNEQHHA
jgi:transcriptional regulator with XRE-family HTH domain